MSRQTFNRREFACFLSIKQELVPINGNPFDFMLIKEENCAKIVETTRKNSYNINLLIERKKKLLLI